jgi:hypothetical protein
MKTTGIAFWNENGNYSVEVREAEQNIADVFEYLIIPVLLAAGYKQESIDNYLDGIRTPDLP